MFINIVTSGYGQGIIFNVTDFEFCDEKLEKIRKNGSESVHIFNLNIGSCLSKV